MNSPPAQHQHFEGESQCHPSEPDMRALPFGAKSAVVDFNRVARLLWAIGCHLHVPWYNYFDDFPTLTHAALEVSTMQSVKVMLELLGFALTLDKLRPFAQVAEMLGVP